MSRTGHSSTKEVRSYKWISEQLQADVSDILNANKKQKCEVKKPASIPSSLYGAPRHKAGIVQVNVLGET